ncbi:MAG: nitro/flavin reductase family protein [Paenibacillaceae bacterium]|jgi:FMN reductase (NADPH)|nr:nitro/flavin reductase family protein [Paenibacillaceae bacterium]
MNETIRTLLNHRSIRLYEDKPLTDEEIHLIVRSAQAAASSSFVQAYTIIGIKDKNMKIQLSALAGNQPYVAANGHLFVFCLDFHRLELAAQLEKVPPEEIEITLSSTEKFMVGVIDATLAAQNAVVAAESLGLGTVYIGGLRNHLPEVNELLGIPSRVVPLFALCVGYPVDLSQKKSRLPLDSIYHEEQYNRNEDLELGRLAQYNEEISAYYRERTEGVRTERWTAAIAKQLRSPKRLYLKDYLRIQRLPLD